MRGSLTKLREERQSAFEVGTTAVSYLGLQHHVSAPRGRYSTLGMGAVCTANTNSLLTSAALPGVPMVPGCGAKDQVSRE